MTQKRTTAKASPPSVDAEKKKQLNIIIQGVGGRIVVLCKCGNQQPGKFLKYLSRGVKVTDKFRKIKTVEEKLRCDVCGKTISWADYYLQSKLAAEKITN